MRVLTWIARLALGGLLLIVAYFVAVQIRIRTPVTKVTSAPVSRSEFTNRFGDIDLPLSATNILAASSSVGMGFAGAFLYRFDAPAEDCQSFAASLMDKNNQETSSESQMVNTNLVVFKVNPAPILSEMLKTAYGLKELAWFDVDNIKSGLHGQCPPGGRGLFWIDLERGRFYYYWTD